MRDLGAHAGGNPGQLHIRWLKITKTYAELLAIQMPEPPHEYLVLLGKSEPRGENFGKVYTALQPEVLVEVEEHVVEDRELLMIRVIAFADLIVKLV